MNEVKLEFKQIPTCASVAAIMMVKNEKKRIRFSLESVTNAVDAIIVYDTGSTDETPEIIKTFCEKHRINLYMIFGTFVNFSESRNVLLDYCDKIPVRFLLHMDCNDELRGHAEFKLTLQHLDKMENTGFLMRQVWFHGGVDSYFNIRLTKNRCGWRYKGVVHEYIEDTTKYDDESKKPNVVRLEMESIFLYQDRTQDDDKTGKRFHRDQLLLEEELKRDPTNTRNMFYLAQTYDCLGKISEAYVWYKKRYEDPRNHDEERYLSCVRCGIANLRLGGDWETSFVWFTKAIEVIDRVESYIFIIRHYMEAKSWRMAYFYSAKAISLSHKAFNLFINKLDYEYTRYELHAQICYRMAENCAFFKDSAKEKAFLEEGCKCAQIAAKYRNTDENKKKLSFFLEKLYPKTEKTKKNKAT